uniref:Uncharacterized protein n=1 Tax=Tanacetum cinerariifolium TaxID=118510 RepID=A0A6L2JJ38_TANCI|nr:hypothetical protein [Tanacetum cinerariifolium]
MNYDNLAERSIHPRDVVDWEFLSNKGLAQSDAATLSGLRREETITSTHLTHLFWPSISDDRFNVGNIKSKSIRDPWIKLAHRGVVEEDKGDDEEGDGKGGNEGAGGFVDIYRNMSAGDLQGSDAEVMPQLITYSIAGRSQAPKKVTVADLFYLRGMDVGSINIPYLLARYFRLFALGRKQGTMISGDLLVIDMAELMRLQICVKLDDNWAWIAPRPERQPDATAGTLEVIKEAPVADEGTLAVPAPVQAPQPPPCAVKPARTMA